MARHAQITQNNKFAISSQHLKKEMSDEVDFLHADKHHFPTYRFQNFRHQSFCKVILLLLMGMIKHSHSTQSNKFAISLLHLQKEVKDGVQFLQADKHQSFYKLEL